MIEATAAPPSEDALAGAPAALEVAHESRALRRSIAFAAAWLLFTAGLMWFIAAGSVRVGAGHWLGQRLRVRVIWSRFLDYLADHGANSLVVGLVALAAVLTLLGSLALLWWTLGQHVGDSDEPVAPDVS